MTAVMTRPEPHVEADDYSQAPAEFPPVGDPNGESPGDESDARPKGEEPATISIADALVRNAANRAKLIEAARETIEGHEKAKADYIAEVDRKIADLRTQIGEPVKTRKPRTPKQAPVEAVSPSLAAAIAEPKKRRGRKSKAIAQADPSPALFIMTMKQEYGLKELTRLIKGKPGELLAGAIKDGLVKREGRGVGTKYTRVK